jgi:RNA polymerase sigma-70 factor (ECF subfamily)
MVRFTNSSTIKAALADPDVKLMLRVRAGDVAAYNELFRRYNDRVQAVITYLMGNRQSTEDLAQEVFLRVYRARHNYVVRAKFSTWLFTIVNNVVSNARRSLGRRREVNIVLDDPDGSHVENLWCDTRVKSPAQVAEHKELSSLVHHGISQLVARQQAAVSLCDLVGMTYADVATELGTTPDAAKSLIHRGRMNLRKVLEPSVRCGDVL